MLKSPYPQQYRFETITLDELVPEDHLVRQIDGDIDFEFIRDAVAHLYCHDIRANLLACAQHTTQECFLPIVPRTMTDNLFSG